MQLRQALLALFISLSWAVWEPAYATVHIADDYGGRIGEYVDRFEVVRNSGENVIIDGLCASACTIVLSKVPRERICVTPRANLGFHAAWDLGNNKYGAPAAITNPEATQMLYSMYPSKVQHWIAARGGLTPHMIFLRGKQLTNLYRPCTLQTDTFAAHSLY